MTAIAQGSVVRLKSGGPTMTVASTGLKHDAFSGYPIVKAICQWFEGITSFSGEFALTSLETIS